MPITVSKSPLARSDPETTKALQNVMDRLEEQSGQVKSVTILANFSVDKIASLQYGKEIVQGLVVQVSKEYKLSEADMSWFHPEIASGRSVFEVDQLIPSRKLTGLEMDGLQSSVGSYTISSPDDFGCEEVKYHVVVDSSATASLQGLYQKWLSTGATAEEVDKQWKRMKFGDQYGISKATSDARLATAQKIAGSAKLIYSDTVRSVLSDSSSVYFTNNVVKQTEGLTLIKSSALGGYRTYNCNNESIRFLPATLGQSNEFYSWNNMTRQNCARIQKSCSWDGELTFNASVMTPPAITGPKIREMEDAYELSFRDTLTMNTARFSPTDQVRDSMSPADILHLTPSQEHSSAAQDFISAPVNMGHPVLKQLMDNIEKIQAQWPDFKLFNPQIMKDGRLKIPKPIYSQLA